MTFPTSFKKDYYGGALMVLIGVAAIYASVSYNIGSLAEMGPGFFPCAIGVLLTLIGLLMAASASAQDPSVPTACGHTHEPPDLRGAVCIVLAVLAFIGFGEYLGLLPATFAIVFIAALGDRSNSVTQAAVLALVLSLISAVVFWWALRLQLPLFKWGN